MLNHGAPLFLLSFFMLPEDGSSLLSLDRHFVQTGNPEMAPNLNFNSDLGLDSGLKTSHN